METDKQSEKVSVRTEKKLTSKLCKGFDQFLCYRYKAAFTDASIVGTDISNKSLEIAWSEQPAVEFIAEGGMTSREGEFDLIFVASVYHHVPVTERQDVCNLLYHRLNSRRNLFVFEHNPYNPVTRRIVSSCPYDEDSVLLQPRELRMHLRQAGFKNPHIEYCLFVPPSLTRITWLESLL